MCSLTSFKSSLSSHFLDISRKFSHRPSVKKVDLISKTACDVHCNVELNTALFRTSFQDNILPKVAAALRSDRNLFDRQSDEKLTSTQHTQAEPSTSLPSASRMSGLQEGNTSSSSSFAPHINVFVDGHSAHTSQNDLESFDGSNNNEASRQSMPMTFEHVSLHVYTPNIVASTSNQLAGIHVDSKAYLTTHVPAEQAPSSDDLHQPMYASTDITEFESDLDETSDLSAALLEEECDETVRTCNDKTALGYLGAGLLVAIPEAENSWPMDAMAWVDGNMAMF